MNLQTEKKKTKPDPDIEVRLALCLFSRYPDFGSVVSKTGQCCVDSELWAHGTDTAYLGMTRQTFKGSCCRGLGCLRMIGIDHSDVPLV